MPSVATRASTASGVEGESRPRASALIWVLAVLQLPFMWVASAPIVPPDLWWTVKLGELLVASGQLDHSAALTYTAYTTPQINAQWLAQVFYFQAYRLGDLEGVAFMTAIVATATFGLLYLACRVVGASPPLAALSTLIGMSASMTNLSPRPQIFAYPLFTLTLLLLLVSARRPLALIGLPLAVALWANVHGSFPLGVVLVGIFLAGAVLERLVQRVRPLAILRDRRVLALGATLVLCAAAMGLNPYGYGILGYVVGLASNPIIRQYVTEWAPTTFGEMTGTIYFATLFVFVIAAHLSSRRLTATEALLAMAVALLGLQSIRSVIWWGIGAAPIVARLLSDVPIPPELHARVQQANRPVGGGSRTLLNALVAALWLLALLASIPWLKPINPLLPPAKRTMFGPELPLRATAFLRDTPQGARMFNYQGWGGYLEWALGPQQRTFVDGRIEVHSPQVYLDYLTVESGGARWEEILAGYGADHLILSQIYQGYLIALVRESPRWRVTYEDDQAVVFVRLS